MILIISEDRDDVTDKVISWLVYRKASFRRVNHAHNSVTPLTMAIDDQRCFVQIEEMNDVRVVWHRRARLNLFNATTDLQRQVVMHLKSEEEVVLKAIETMQAKRARYFGGYVPEMENNKLLQLQLASEAGLSIPATIVTNRKHSLQKFFNQHRKIITKDLRYPVSFQSDSNNYSSSGTFLVKQQMLDDMTDVFSPMLAQEYIEKDFEIRCYYFGERLYSMAIFSQRHARTEVDYRHYDVTQQNKFVPFDLPADLRQKLQQYIARSGYNTGSIDLIRATDGHYVFLEVNPQGQFGWLSEHCNYQVEKDIAEVLIMEDAKS